MWSGRYACAVMLSCTALLLRKSSAWAPTSSRKFLGRSISQRTTQLLRKVQIDEEGRRIRGGRRQEEEENDFGGWDSFDPTEERSPVRKPPPRRQENTSWDNGNDGWDDFDSSRPRKSSNRQIEKPRRNTGSDRRGGQARGGGPRRGPPNRDNKKSLEDRKINLKALEGAGFVHLYGLAPVVNALRTGKRDMERPEDRIDIDELEGEELAHELKQRERRPETQFSPWLFVQEQYSGGRAKDKRVQAEQAMELAEERGVPVATVDKGVLNSLAGNRPHQGYVLRCGKLYFEPLSRIPYPEDGSNSLWLVLDEVVDPQNLGALIRSAFFLGAGSVNVLVCSKNSAPPSPAVSAASAGALELVDVYSTSNLPRTLATAEQDGFRVIGASSSVPQGVDETMIYELGEESHDETKPTILVLGSEGHGLRNLVARSCTEFVRIGGGGGDPEGVDSLNVSVTGGILLWHFLQSMK